MYDHHSNMNYTEQQDSVLHCLVQWFFTDIIKAKSRSVFNCSDNLTYQTNPIIVKLSANNE